MRLTFLDFLTGLEAVSVETLCAKEIEFYDKELRFLSLLRSLVAAAILELINEFFLFFRLFMRS